MSAPPAARALSCDLVDPRTRRLRQTFDRANGLEYSGAINGDRADVTDDEVSKEDLIATS